MPQWLRNIPWEIVWVLVIVLGPGLKGVLSAVARKRKEREALLARERAQIESLRTGRKAVNEVSAYDALETSAAKRPPAPPVPQPTQRPQPRTQQPQRAQRATPRPQQQPQQQPQRAGASASVRVPPSPPTTPAGQTRLLRLPGGIVLEIPVEAPSQQSQQQAQRQAQQRQAQQKQAQQRRGTTIQAREPEPKPKPTTSRAAVSPIVASEISTPTVSKRVHHMPIDLPKTRTQWRQAVVMREILSPPLSLR